ncbi:aconitase X catalytic domain-containing protein [Candidatus Bathyarchaeota archaeon]|nr:aconitase X catalytic domain-containing protein [Candidatus Bathyarchaeota archaeon]
MHLTREEEKIYDGELGWAYQVSMRILVKLGDLYGADNLIPIESAHISGVSYKTIGDAAIDFLEALAGSDVKTSVTATTNPAGIDYENAIFTSLSGDIIKKQKRIINLYAKMGIKASLTCTPYYIKAPRCGAHLSWAESSAVVYANSMIGAWTNREGGPSALASALIGKTPNYGLHKPENRQAAVLVKVEAELRDESDYGALGIYLGKILKDKIPLIQGLPSNEEGCLKQMGAAMATSGMVSMFHVGRNDMRLMREMETINVEDRNLCEAREGLSISPEKPDLIFIGCPHCSLNELKQIAEAIKGKKVRNDVKLWVCTSRFIRNKAKEYVDVVESSGGQVICDTCAVVTWLRDLNVKTLMTNSAKTAYYAPSLNGVKVVFSPLTECINVACQK